MVKSKFAPIVFLLTIILFSPAWVQADNIQLNPDGTVPGTPFEQLQVQIDALSSQLSGPGGLEARVTALETENAAQAALITALQAEQAVQNGFISTLQAQVADLQSGGAALAAIFAGASRSSDTILFTGVNLQIVDGSGDTDGRVNGLGNLIVGYNEEIDPYNGDGTPVSNKVGSHNIVVGTGHNYSSYGGLVAGHNNIISQIYASVTGGLHNTASGGHSSVSGGQLNFATGSASSVSGGQINRASAVAASVSGGGSNTASGFRASISGGNSNRASGEKSSVNGGGGNTASGTRASVSGGFFNTASGIESSVSGGNRNTASGIDSSVSGGSNRTATGENDWRAGSLFEDF